MSCLKGFRTADSVLPNPWVALAARPHLKMTRLPISEPGRYYDDERAIVLRRGLKLAEERRHLWHEITHSDRRDRFGHSSLIVEDQVEKAAVKLALPFRAMQWGAYQTESMYELADLLKLPQSWVEFRWRIMSRWEKRTIREQDPIYGLGQFEAPGDHL